jgi:hypothetical protein
MIYSGNTIVKIVEPNKGRHIAFAGDINTIVPQRKTQVEHTALSKLKFFQEEILLRTFKHVNIKGFT